MNNIEKIFHLADIIYRQLIEQVNQEEQKLLDDWLVKDKHHREMMEGFSKTDYLEKQSIEHDLFEADKGYKRFQQGRRQIDKRRMFRRWITVAAMVIGGSGIALFLFLSHLQNSDEPMIPGSLAEFAPGQSRATLVLADGKQLILSDTLEKQFSQPATKLQISEGILNYHSSHMPRELVFNRVITPRGGEYKLELADGTRVWLNAETDFKYPVTFVGEKREVWLNGEAYFEVAKDCLHPFIIQTSQVYVQVLGTSFNVKAYPDEIEQTTLVEGKVKVKAGGKEQEIVPGEQLAFYQGELKVKQVEVETFIAWKDQRFAFTDDLLENVLRKLERWYDVEFFIRNISIREFRFTGNLPKYENLEKVLQKLELTTHIHFVQKGRTVIVEED